MKKYLLMALMTAMLACAGLFAACEKTGEQKPGPQPGGEQTQQEVTYTITGEETVYVKSGDTQYDFVSTVSVSGSDGSVNTPTVDISNVDFDVKGEYTATYSYEDAAPFTQKVVVMTPPAFAQDTQDVVEISYSEVQDHLFDDLTAQDCFGQTLEVGILNGGEESLYVNGILQYGEHQLDLRAIDRAGNVAEWTVTVTVLPEADAPVSDDSTLTVDVTADNVTWPVNLFGKTVSLLSVNGNNEVTYEVVDGGIRFEFSALTDLVLGETYEVIVVTNSGYAETDLTLTDNLDPVMLTVGLDNWIYCENKSGILPVAEKKYERQNYTIQYTLTDAEGTEIAVTDGMMPASEAGDYRYTVVPVKNGQVLSALQKTLSVHVLQAAEYESIVTMADSTQFDVLKPSVSVEELLGQGVNVQYGFTEEHGGSYIYCADKIGSYWPGYEFTVDPGTEYKTLSFDLYCDYYANPEDSSQNTPHCVCVAVANSKISLLKQQAEPGTPSEPFANWDDRAAVYLLDDDGNAICMINPYTKDNPMGMQKWLRVEVSLEGMGGQSGKIQFFNEWWGEFYVKNVRLSKTEVSDKSEWDITETARPSDDTQNASNGNEYTFTRENVAGKDALKFTLNALDAGYANFFQNGVLLGSFAGSSSDWVCLNYEKVVFDIYASEGAQPVIALGYYTIGNEAGFHQVNFVGMSDYTRILFYDEEGNNVQFRTGEWLRCEFSLAEFKENTHYEYFKLMIGSTIENEYFAIANVVLSEEEFTQPETPPEFTLPAEVKANYDTAAGGNYSLQKTEVAGVLADKLTITGNGHGENFFQNALYFSPYASDNPDNTDLGALSAYKKLTFDLYAASGSNPCLSLGHYTVGGVGGFYEVGLNGLSDFSRVRLYDMAGNPIEFTPDTWIHVEFLLDVSGVESWSYQRIMLGTKQSPDTFLAVANIAYSTYGFEAQYEAPGYALWPSVRLTYDAANSNGEVGLTEEETGGRIAAKVTITSISHGANSFQNGILAGPFEGDNTNYNVVKDYTKVVFDLYAAENSDMNIGLGYYTKDGQNAYHVTRLADGGDLLKFYDMQGNETTYTTGTWLRVEFLMSDIAIANTQGMFRVIVGSANAANTYFAVDNLHFSTAEL